MRDKYGITVIECSNLGAFVQWNASTFYNEYNHRSEANRLKSTNQSNELCVDPCRKVTVPPIMNLPNPNKLSQCAPEVLSLICATFTGCCCAEIGWAPHSGYGRDPEYARWARRKLANLDPAPQPDHEFGSIEVYFNKDINKNISD